MNNMNNLIVKTSLGNLVAEAEHSKDYPGIRIRLGNVMYALVEVDETLEDGEPVLKVHAYDAKNDDPVADVYSSKTQIEKYAKE